MRILLLGGSGQVGTELRQRLDGKSDLVCPGIGVQPRVNFTNGTELERLVADVAPQVIINAAAYTAVDKAESEQELANAVNAVAPGILAQSAAKIGAAMLHYSTDYVFDGSGHAPHTEKEVPHPLNHYGASKLAGERQVSQNVTRYLIFRTSWVYAPHGNNFLKTMLRLASERDSLNIVDDQIGAPTSAALIADASLEALRKALAMNTDWGLYHLTATGSVSWYGFAQKIFYEALDKGLLTRAPDLHPIASSSYPQAAKRPLNSRLDTTKFQNRFDVKLPPWERDIIAYFEQRP